MDVQTKQSSSSEVAGVDLRPGFGKIMFPGVSAGLRIPPAFKKQIVNEQAAKVTLKTRCGSWKVMHLEREGEVYLTHGWAKFVEHHSLGNMEYLVFKYNGKLCFDVDIYENTGWKRVYGQSPSTFTSNEPYFEHRISRYNVGSKSTLVIPNQFAREHISVPYPEHITLRNQDNMSWLISIVRNGKSAMMSARWKSFADQNSLKVGDTCIFELVEENVMQVHIFRST